jgi:large subunit ribosomal protein L13
MKLTTASKLIDFQGKRKWYVIDAQDIVLGKLATKTANILRGKDKPSFSAHVDCGDNVIVINCDKVALTGNKMKGKLYHRHSGYLGNLKTQTAEDVMEKTPKRIIHEAVNGMLPKNKLRKHYIKKLYIYTGTEHKHAGQNPTTITV